MGETTMSDLERRYTPGNVEVVRAANDKKSIGGYAAKFNKQSRNLGGFVEQIDIRAFNKSRGDGWPEVIARYNHDDMWILGRTDAGTLRLSVDDVGLFYEADINPDDSHALIVHARIARGDVGKSSFAFRVMGDGEEWGLNDMDIPLRTLTNVQLVDVAPVNVPAYNDTSSALRSLANHMDAPLEEIRKLAGENELRRLFKRTDQGGTQPQQHFGAAARIALLGRKTDPWA
jgi:HK97 family phage prohead protease